MVRFFRLLSEVIVVASMLVVALLWTCSALLTLFGLFISHRFRREDSIGAQPPVAVTPAHTFGRYRS